MQATIPQVFINFSAESIAQSERNINACLGRLTDEQILYQPAPHENSVANLLMHLSGNIRQWILHGIDGQPNVRTRDAEFAAPTLSLAEIRERFADTLAEAQTKRAAAEERWLELELLREELST